MVGKNGRYVFDEMPGGKAGTLFFKLFPLKLILAIKKHARKENIDIIHFLTGEFVLGHYVNLFLTGRYKLLYTVHDAVSHSQNGINGQSLLSVLQGKIFIDIPLHRLLKRCNILITNSREQYDYLKTAFPKKEICFHQFPNLINNNILEGSAVCPEIKEEKDYILFFGSMWYYKGIDLLYQAYMSNPQLQKNKLVMAGNGVIYFKRDLEREDNKVIILNRFIRDDEIKALFKNARCVVYPYRSITQSGVVSLAYAFQTPLLVSNLPFFMELIAENETALSFETENAGSLSEKLQELLGKTDIKSMREAYPDYYSKEELKEQLISIYNNIH
jgi:glycosyltransferase involved in cell wall biosynthesis